MLPTEDVHKLLCRSATINAEQQFVHTHASPALIWFIALWVLVWLSLSYMPLLTVKTLAGLDNWYHKSGYELAL